MAYGGGGENEKRGPTMAVERTRRVVGAGDTDSRNLMTNHHGKKGHIPRSLFSAARGGRSRRLVCGGGVAWPSRRLDGGRATQRVVSTNRVEKGKKGRAKTRSQRARGGTRLADGNMHNWPRWPWAPMRTQRWGLFVCRLRTKRFPDNGTPLLFLFFFPLSQSQE
jgi:hypothetical protein